MAEFPSSLPKPDLAYGFENRPTSRRTQNASKGFLQRPSSTLVSTIIISVQWTFTQAEYNTFLDWFVDDLESGTLPFDIELTLGDDMTTYECEFEESDFSMSHTGNEYYVVSSNMICYDAGNIPSEEALDLILELSEDISILEDAVQNAEDSDLLHVLVNETIPNDDWGDV